LNLLDAPVAAAMLTSSPSARHGRPAILAGTIAMFVPGEHSSNDLSFSVKIQTKSELEILVLAMPIPASCFQGL